MKITPDMIEAAAKAIQRQFAMHSAGAKSWDKLLETSRQSYRKEAKAALEAAFEASDTANHPLNRAQSSVL